MEYNRAFLLLVFVSLCTGLEVTILDSTRRMVNPGITMNLTCQLDDGLPIILSHTIQWVHVPLNNPDQRDPEKRKETILTNQQTLSDNAYPEEFGIDVKYDNDFCKFTLIVKEVKPSSDGTFICRVTQNSDGAKIEKSAEVIVVNNVESIAMQFDGEESITTEDSVGMQREEGKYGVTCTANGFNPDASIQLFLGEEEQETGGTQIKADWVASVAAGARRYTASATAAEVHLMAAHTGKRLTCLARAGFEGAADVVASVPLTVIALEPVITCDQNASARPGELYVKITCMVDHENIEIDRYSWLIEKTGETIEQHETNENYHEVIVEEVGEHKTNVTLDLYEVDESHFETLYYLNVFTKSGQNFREPAALIRLDPLSDSSTKTSAALLVCLLSVMLSLFSCW